ncbi:MAG: hypothetical protein VX113_09760, partial [Pseudomonadota bacterium]|nr:hypothetical protein [Pseudomonadota bacterium]
FARTAPLAALPTRATSRPEPCPAHSLDRQVRRAARRLRGGRVVVEERRRVKRALAVPLARVPADAPARRGRGDDPTRAARRLSRALVARACRARARSLSLIFAARAIFFPLALSQARPAVVELFRELAPAAAPTRGFNDRVRAIVAAVSRRARAPGEPVPGPDYSNAQRAG